MEEKEQTQLERLQEEVKVLEKMSSLGMLSAGIAHEIQNPLNFVINFSEMSCRLMEDLEDIIGDQQSVLSESAFRELTEVLEGLRDNLKKIKDHGERAVSIIRGILLYSRGKEDEFIPTNVQHLVKEYVWLAYHAMRANHKEFNLTIRECYDPTIALVKLIPQDFSRVVLNLMNNACYAMMEKSRRLTVGYQPELRVTVGGVENGFFLSLEDNGTGMPDEVMAKLFTPFFTTKPVGEGTGLGLSIIRSIVEEKHGGTIRVQTEEGKGTEFRIEIRTK